MAPLTWLLLSLFVGASAAEKPKRSAPQPQQTVERAAFDQSLDLIKEQAAKSYLSGQAMPDASLLDPLIAGMPPEQKPKAQQTARALSDLLEEAAYVQRGRQSIDDEQTYREMVDLFADRLGAGAFVEALFARDKTHAAAIADCRAKTANPSSAESRLTCLGRAKAESLYCAANRPVLERPLMESRDQTSVRALVLAAVAETHSRIGDQVPARVTDRLNATRALLMTEISGSIVREAAAAVTVTGRGSIPVQSPGRKPPPIPDAVLSASPFMITLSPSRSPTSQSDLSLSPPPLQGADLKAGAHLAQVAVDNQVGFTERCYSYVKKALAAVGIMDRDEGGGSAYMFNRFFKEKHLENRKLHRLPDPRWPLPIGSIVVWSPGACGYSEEHGHIEILVSIKPPRACSDGCGGFQVDCMTTYVAQQKKAAADFQQFSTERDALKQTISAAAKPSLVARERQRLSRVEYQLKVLGKTKDNPRVNAYILERPSS